MSNMWRLIQHPACEPALNMAIDSALAQCYTDTPVLRLYQWSKPAITIGYFQDIEKEVNITLCREKGIEVIRRVTGGGAVFHHEEITYSLVHPLQGIFVNCSIVESYKFIAQALITALQTIGVNATYKPINDIVVSGKKISGSAQTRKHNILLQHGTLLVATDVQAMLSCLSIHPQKLKGEDIPVVTLQQLLPGQTKETIYQNLLKTIVEAFTKQFDVKFIESDITAEEKQVTQVLQQTYFSYEGWNYARKPKE